MDDDFYTGETFESKDRRDTGRRIFIVARAGETRHGMPRYSYITRTNPGNPSRVGRTGFISGNTLNKWLKVSH